MSGHRWKPIILFMAAFAFMPLQVKAAAVFDEVNPLNFGKWIILGNRSVYTVTVNTNNSYSNSPGIIMLEAPEAGVYDISGLPANTAILSIDVTMVSPLSGPGGENLALDNLTATAPDTDGDGKTTLRLGGRAKTSGNGTGLGAGHYTGEVEITINL